MSMKAKRLYIRSQILHTKSEAALEESVSLALEETVGNVRRAADMLGIAGTTLTGLLQTGRLSHLAHLMSRRRGNPGSGK